MKRDTTQNAEKFVKEHRRKKRWYSVITVLACVVALCTGYFLIWPAFAMEQEPEHVHSETCYDESGALICSLGEEPNEETANPPALDDADANNNEQLGEIETQRSNPEESQSEEDLPAPVSDDTIVDNADQTTTEADNPTDATDEIAFESNGMAGEPNRAVSEGGKVAVEMRYDSAGTLHPDGVEVYTRSTASGYIYITPQNLNSYLRDVTITLTIPKKYVEKDTVKVSEFAGFPGHSISDVEENGENYEVRISIPDNFWLSSAFSLPFSFSFLDERTPQNYVLPVTATVSYTTSDGQYDYYNAENSIDYKPKYYPCEVTKFVNSNKLWAYQEDGADYMVTSEENGNPTLGNDEYVPFQFLLNAQPSGDGTSYRTADCRDLQEVTLVDTLPTYKDKNGQERTAVFDQDKNPGWNPIGDNMVSKTYKGNNTSEILKQIAQDTLRLKFPELGYEKDDNNVDIATLTNNVSMEGVPSNPLEGESRVTATDNLTFKITTNSYPQGNFSKHDDGDIYDTLSFKEAPYEWDIQLRNDRVFPLTNIVIRDCRIQEQGMTLKGPDDRLKFVKLVSQTHSGFPLANKQTYQDVIDRVVIHYADDHIATVLNAELSWNNGNFSLDFDSDKVCVGFEIYFKDSYAMSFGEGVWFKAYTVYKDPKGTKAEPQPDNAAVPEKNIYRNEAGFTSTSQVGNKSFTATAKMEDWYIMNPNIANLTISKDNFSQNNGSNMSVGDTVSFYLRLRGSLMEDVDYNDLQVVDLLPDGVDYTAWVYSELFNPVPFVTKVEIRENYHNSGRTAVILSIDATKLLEAIRENKIAPFAGIHIQAKINTKLSGTSDTNYAYVVSKDLPDGTGSNFTKDIYDLDNDGDMDDMIAWGKAVVKYTPPETIYGEKYVQNTSTNITTKQGITIQNGSEFNYFLRVVNNQPNTTQSGLVVYDVLPRIDDKDIFVEKPRNSDFAVYLRDSIQAPDDYTVYYTTHPAVLTNSMDALLAANIWEKASEITKYSEVTAFKIVANPGQTLNVGEKFEVTIPVCAEGELTEESMKRLKESDSSYLQAINTFGFKCDTFTSSLQSNPVWVRIPFAEFTLRKVDSKNHELPLEGAEFTLKDSNGNVIETKTTGQDGLVRFKDLAAGDYTVTETQAPAGYYNVNLPSIQVHIEWSGSAMEYKLTLTGVNGEEYSGAGTAVDPLLIENVSGYELPATGGPGSTPYMLGGFLMISATLPILLYQRKRRKFNDAVR